MRLCGIRGGLTLKRVPGFRAYTGPEVRRTVGRGDDLDHTARTNTGFITGNEFDHA
ncbi:hypothetical protein GCM10025779_30360 [Arthrobacter cryoconiti]